MGSCLSKKSTSCSSSASATATNGKQEFTQVENKKEVEAESVKKEIFVIKHRKSHEVDRKSEEEKGKANEAKEGEIGMESGIIVSAPVRTSSCTKEEVDAILIQCGRLSRSSSTGKTGLLSSCASDNNSGNPQRSRKYSGSKRSFDFENENGNEGIQENVVDCEDDGIHRQRQRQRQPSSPSKGRRRTPSREREQQGRSGSSRDRGTTSGGGGVRRVSRSPGRRSESPITASAANNGDGRPGKMVSVPATVSSMVMDKSIDAGRSDNISAAAIKRIQVKRIVGADGPRSAASPRARSPARLNAKESQLPVSLSRSNSRKQEQSPYRRNPLGEIDTNVVIEQMPLKALSQVQMQKQNAETGSIVQQGSENKCKTSQDSKVAMNVIVSGPEGLKPPQGVTRSRSLRLSRDLDINIEALSNPPQSSYTALLLEDIQNFHQKGNTTTPAFSLPACVTKACSILDAVADLNSTTSSNMSSAFSDDRRRNNNPTAEPFNQRLGIKDPFVESEVSVGDDLMEPSIQKYITFRRGGDVEEQESSGSNSIVVGGQQNWLSPSSWEPNSADSTDCWKSYSRDDSRNAVSETGHDMMVEQGKRRVNLKKRDSDNQQTGIGRGRIGSRGQATAGST